MLETKTTMKKPTHVVLRRKGSDPNGTMSVYNDSKWEVPEGYPPRPEPPHPHPGPHPGPPGPPPGPWPPTPVDPDELKFGMGLRVDGNVVSVKIDPHGYPGLKVTPAGLSLSEAMGKIEWQERKINELAAIIVDLKSQINKLKLATSPTMIAKALAATYDIFVMDGNQLSIKLGDGLILDSNGRITVNAGRGLKFESDAKSLSVDPDTTININEDNEFGVNIDNDTILVNEDGKLSASADTSWKEYKTN